MFRHFLILLSVALAGLAAPLQAAVTLTFYGKDLDDYFPHAFVAMSGTPDAGGAAADGNYGFTAKRISPAILFGSVEGEVMAVSTSYVRRAKPRLSMLLSDDQYAAVLATIDKWRNLPQKSYNLNRRNCVFFVSDIARVLGLTVQEDPKLMKKPVSFLTRLKQMNPQVQEVAAVDPAVAGSNSEENQLEKTRVGKKRADAEAAAAPAS